MAFKTKTDRCGIIAATASTGGNSPYMIRDAQRGGSEPSEIYQEELKCGQVEFEPYGEDGQPSNTYAVKGGEHTIAAGAIKLGAVVTVEEGEDDTKKYGLASYGHGTRASNPVTVNATAQLLEDDVDDEMQAYWPLPAHKVASYQCPQDVYGACTLSGKGCSFSNMDDNAQININPDKVAGKIISSDSNTGYISVTGTILRSIKVPDSEEPTITPNSNTVDLGFGLTSKWVLVKAPKKTENNPETASPTYEFELRLPLKKVKPWEDDSGAAV